MESMDTDTDTDTDTVMDTDTGLMKNNFHVES